MRPVAFTAVANARRDLQAALAGKATTSVIDCESLHAKHGRAVALIAATPCTSDNK